VSTALTRLVVVGAGGHGRELLNVIDAMNGVNPIFDVVGVVNEGGDPGDILARRGIPFLGGHEALSTVAADAYALGLGSPDARRNVDLLASGEGLACVSLIHPTALLGSDLRLGPGFVAADYAQVTMNVSAGRHVHINIAANVSHDCELCDYVTLSL